MRIGSLDDLDRPSAGRGNCLHHSRSLITCIGDYFFGEWKAPPHAWQQVVRAVAVLYVGGQNTHAKKETERVDEDMALAARDLLARIEALRVNRRAPF